MTYEDRLIIYAKIRLDSAKLSIQFWKKEIKKLEKQKITNKGS